MSDLVFETSKTASKTLWMDRSHVIEIDLESNKMSLFLFNRNARGFLSLQLLCEPPRKAAALSKIQPFLMQILFPKIVVSKLFFMCMFWVSLVVLQPCKSNSNSRLGKKNNRFKSNRWCFPSDIHLNWKNTTGVTIAEKNPPSTYQQHSKTYASRQKTIESMSLSARRNNANLKQPHP